MRRAFICWPHCITIIIITTVVSLMTDKVERVAEMVWIARQSKRDPSEPSPAHCTGCPKRNALSESSKPTSMACRIQAASCQLAAFFDRQQACGLGWFWKCVFFGTPCRHNHPLNISCMWMKLLITYGNRSIWTCCWIFKCFGERVFQWTIAMYWFFYAFHVSLCVVCEST